MKNNGFITICSFISPLSSQRKLVKDTVGEDFSLIHINASLNECMSRDPKGLYKKALEGKIKNFTGIGSEYEAPEKPSLKINTNNSDISVCVEKIVNYLKLKYIIFS